MTDEHIKDAMNEILGLVFNPEVGRVVDPLEIIIDRYMKSEMVRVFELDSLAVSEIIMDMSDNGLIYYREDGIVGSLKGFEFRSKHTWKD